MKKSMRCIIGAVLGLAGIVQAAGEIHFDGATANAATANSNIVGNVGSIPAGESRTASLAYNTSTPLLSNGSTYTGQSVYGGFFGSYTNTGGSAFSHNFALLQYSNGASVEDLRSADTFTNGAISRAVGLALMFNPASAGNYTFDGTSVLTATHASTLTGTVEARWLVVANGTTYLSQVKLAAGGSSTSTLDNPDEINWAVWIPGADMTFGTLSYNTLGSSLANITLAGVAVNYSAPASAGSGRYILQKFTADLEAGSHSKLGLYIVGMIAPLL